MEGVSGWSQIIFGETRGLLSGWMFGGFNFVINVYLFRQQASSTEREEPGPGLPQVLAALDGRDDLPVPGSCPLTWPTINLSLVATCLHTPSLVAANFKSVTRFS